MTAERDSLVAQVDAARGNGGIAHHLQELAASAADIQNVLLAFEIRKVELLVSSDVLFRAAEPLLELRIVDGLAGFRGGGSNGSNLGTLANRLELRKNKPLILPANLLQICPETLLHVLRISLQGGGEVPMLRGRDFAEVPVHQSGTVLRGGLQIGNAAQELHFVLFQLALPIGAPRGPVVANVLELVPDLLFGGDAAREFLDGAIGIV